jgi:hypothetical protein
VKCPGVVLEINKAARFSVEGAVFTELDRSPERFVQDNILQQGVQVGTTPKTYLASGQGSCSSNGRFRVLLKLGGE